jgi:hypothetical protein
MGTQEVRPSFYALRPGGWRDYVTLLHLPYTAWHLSYVAVGAAIAPHFHLDRLGWALLAFFLAMGVAAHALDELKGRPLHTQIPDWVLIAFGVAGVAAAAAIGVGAAIAWGYGLLAFIVVGAVLVPAYNLELALHNDVGFALAWGAFPVLTGYFVEAQTLRLDAIGVAVYAFALSLAQRALSTPVRRARRESATTAGTEPLERALRLLTLAAVALSVALVAARLP